ncbi:Citryl-CoA lyase [Sphingobium chlorophenolicum L-1]|uniref:Citryl-CoA lyase n=1 Tax=Sphingobium chlorophenolicum L-1 TaxID=690566 RepID=F6EWB7_SPHCR|nr:CoA ester lyase [Sphingobium chlorophenolicum]AEG49811.1 Citryl-CoA lyase [Sphingobium chlorophenolicum L-1]
MDPIRARRSALYMPATNSRAIEKARELPCDVVILDLEDAVAPDMKEVARESALAAARAGGFGRRELVLRVNGLDEPWGKDDLAAARDTGFDAVLVPKVSQVEDLRRCRDKLGAATPLWAMIETCTAFSNLPDLAAASSAAGCKAWVIGTNDLAKEMRCRLDAARTALMPALSFAVIAARARGIALLDGVFNDLEDGDGFEQQCRQGLALGFDGKTLIHPRQVATANRVFSPELDEVRWSQQIVDAFALPENASSGVLKVDGRMVERLHLEEAQRIIALAQLAAE